MIKQNFYHLEHGGIDTTEFVITIKVNRVSGWRYYSHHQIISYFILHKIVQNEAFVYLNKFVNAKCIKYSRGHMENEFERYMMWMAGYLIQM